MAGRLMPALAAATSANANGTATPVRISGAKNSGKVTRRNRAQRA
ncbi:hypothetical protein X767_00805 [Mesorhizobium sp. LSJC264A00]|nr:hypothetical protein X767_00805 [Mesorhizobium sp. LSJC264A00]